MTESFTHSSDKLYGQRPLLTARILDLQWPARPGVVTADIKTYGCGIGSEFVYCYTFPTYVEIAKLKGEDSFRVKVGKADRNPLERICHQLGGSKTATPEFAHVILIFQTLASGHLERWLHRRLERVTDASGSEWFKSNPDELVRLYHEYLQNAEVTTEDSSPSESVKPVLLSVNKVMPDTQRATHPSPPLSPLALKWNAVSDAADGATPNELIAQFGESLTAWRLGKLVNRGDWAILGSPPAPLPGKNLQPRSAQREYGRAIIAACGNNKITVLKAFKSRRR